MDNIDILIYSDPKTGGNTLKSTLINSKFKVYYTHDKNFFILDFPGQSNKIQLVDYINNESKHKKLTIISIFRNELDRLISYFFQSFAYLTHTPEKNICNIPTDELINIFNNILLNTDKLNCNINGFFELFPNELKNFNFNFNEKYALWENNNIIFIVLRFEDINNWPTILNKIFNTDIKTLINSNFTDKKNYKNNYKEFKMKYQPIDIPLRYKRIHKLDPVSIKLNEII
jgi:hypothetical protein